MTDLDEEAQRFQRRPMRLEARRKRCQHRNAFVPHRHHHLRTHDRSRRPRQQPGLRGCNHAREEPRRVVAVEAVPGGFARAGGDSIGVDDGLVAERDGTAQGEYVL